MYKEAGEYGELIPAATQLCNIELKENERTVLVDVFMPSVRNAKYNKGL